MTVTQRQKQKIQTRTLLIDVALSEFAKNGLITTRTSDIAKAANISHGTVFAHFPTREILLDEVIQEFGMRITSRLHELVGDKCGMKEVLEAHLQGIGEYEIFYTRLVSEAPLLHESARNTLIMIQSAVSFHFNQVADREMEELRILRLPSNLLFNTWVGLIHYYLANGDLFAPGESVIPRYGQQLIDHYMKLISYRREI